MVRDIKASLRRELLAKRAAIRPEELERRSQRLCEELASLLAAKGCQALASFRSFRGEPLLRGLEQHAAFSFPIYYPRVHPEQRSMSFHLWRSGEPFELNRFGIEEPAAHANPLTPDAQTVVLVPALAFDQRGHRLGYGAGFYDRYLAQFPGLKVGVCLEEFRLDAIPSAEHDEPMDYVVTDAAIY